MADDRNRPDTPRNRGNHDAPHLSPVTPAEDIRTIALNRVSWGAVLAGVVTALVTQLILNMLGIGVGASTLNPAGGAADNPSAGTFSIVAAAWWTLAGIIASFAGGYVAGRLSGKPKEGTAGWHGLTSWALTTLVIFYLLTSTIGGVLGGAYNMMSSTLGNVTSAIGQTAQTATQAAAPSLPQLSDPFGAIEQQIRSATGGADPAAMRDAAVAAVRSAITGDQAQAQQARERAAQALSQSRGIPIEQARTEIQQYEQQYRQGVEEATRQAANAADVAAAAVARGALLGSLALILGAIAAWFGGRAGAVQPTLTDAGLGLGGSYGRSSAGTTVGSMR